MTQALRLEEYEAPAVFSDDRRYRYMLRRRFWGEEVPAIFLMLNPSTADETQDDPTIRRCIRYAKTWGCGGLIVLNLFALRSTDPRQLYRADDPIGPRNDAVIAAVCERLPVVCAWGNHGRLNDRGKAVRELLRDVQADVCYLKLTKEQQPSHPLRLPRSLEAKRW